MASRKTLIIFLLVLITSILADLLEQTNPHLHSQQIRAKRNKSDFNLLRKKLNDEKKSDADAAADAPAAPTAAGEIPFRDIMAAHPRMEPNMSFYTPPTNNKQLRKSFGRIVVNKDHTSCDFEDDTTCNWTWNQDAADGFVVANGLNNTFIEPKYDFMHSEEGNFLVIQLKSMENTSSRDSNWTIWSPLFQPTTSDKCKLQLRIFQKLMSTSIVRIVMHNVTKTQVLIDQVHGKDMQEWAKYEKNIGRITQQFQISLEVETDKNGTHQRGAVVAFDDIRLNECYTDSELMNPNQNCTPSEFRCAGTTSKCISYSQVCDIAPDCPDGDDETQNCDKVPFGARCNFEMDWCGWYNAEGRALEWKRHNGGNDTVTDSPIVKNLTGPRIDHTYGNTTGKYLHVIVANSRDALFASSAMLKSVVFNPPPKVHGNLSSPYYNSCTIRFYLHQSGNHKNGLMLQVTELGPKENASTDLLWSYKSFVDPWNRQVVVLPNITHKYFLHFDFRKGIRYVEDIAIDDISLSPECFGLNIPTRELNDYNYWNPVIDHPFSAKPHMTFENETYYEIKTCNATGRFGPDAENCTDAYKGTEVKVNVMKEVGLNGIQKWVVPTSGLYTFILFGASGGKGSGQMGSSRGAMTRLVLELHKGVELYMLIGQEGSSACVRSLQQKNTSSCPPTSASNTSTSIRDLLNMRIEDGGGGGGGGTFLFMRKGNQAYPLAVAAGGGGLGLGRFVDTGMQHGHAINTRRKPTAGDMFGNKTAGAGAGWTNPTAMALDTSLRGQSLLSGAIGGKACYESKDGRGDGGFGGGGGGCTGGGGGGGYAGGNAGRNYSNAEGGYSYIDPIKPLPKFSEALSGYHVGPGMIMIIPAVPGCDCDYRCVALDPRRSQVSCVCPKDWKLDTNDRKCLVVDLDETYPLWIIIVIGIFIICVVVISVVCVIMYNRYRQSLDEVLRRKMMSGPDFQLNRLRVASDSMMTEYNPNYEFGGVVYTLKDLKDIPRDQLRLVKALGQGAFGEVYQGFYRQRSSDTVEMPVAVKTLPEMSTNQAEIDFLMEALIMSKFNHPNIVHFIGVCFDKHPRFIVLELLIGGDLKNFLRESRPKPERTSSLSMKDLVLIAIDVAKGCKYLEENRFIHRDIAARNCLLTTKGPGRVVKIADFGMSRDIYRSDYYRKGGKAMLPIKWMPPEAFLDGIFTSKTDVWSYGVLLWEIMSMGYMPYTGCANREVMQLVTGGGRLESPPNCPGPIYGIMTQCWHPNPDARPTFALLLERMGYCAQDPEVMNAPLPVFNRPPSHERDATVMRPSGDENCLEVPQSTDYLVPTTLSLTTVPCPHRIGSTSSIDKLLPDGHDWETSFVQTKTTMTPTSTTPDEDAGSAEKLLTTTAKSTPISTPNNAISNQTMYNNNANLKTGLSLDAGALVKQVMPVNGNVQTNVPSNKYSTKNSSEITNNGVIQNGPYGNQNQYTSEISC